MLALQLVEMLLFVLLLPLSCVTFFSEKLRGVRTAVYSAAATVLALVLCFVFEADGALLFAFYTLSSLVFGIFLLDMGKKHTLYSLVLNVLSVCAFRFFVNAAAQHEAFIFGVVISTAFTAILLALVHNEKNINIASNEKIKVSLVTLLLVCTFALAVLPVGKMVQNILLGVAFMVGFFVLLSSFKSEDEEERQNKQLAQYQENLSEIYDMMRLFRHDYKNIVVAMKGCLKDKAYDEMQEILSSVGVELDDLNIRQQMSVVAQLEDAAVKWLLTSKLSAAQKYGINISLVVSRQMDYGKLKKHEFNSILGNLLDNAIEAAKDSERKMLKVAVFNKNGDTIVSVKNTYSKRPVLANIFKSGYSEKEGHTGLGLYSVKKIVDAHDEVLMDVRIQDEYFTVDINISNAHGLPKV